MELEFQQGLLESPKLILLRRGEEEGLKYETGGDEPKEEEEEEGRRRKKKVVKDSGGLFSLLPKGTGIAKSFFLQKTAVGIDISNTCCSWIMILLQLFSPTLGEFPFQTEEIGGRRRRRKGKRQRRIGGGENSLRRPRFTTIQCFGNRRRMTARKARRENDI